MYITFFSPAWRFFFAWILSTLLSFFFVTFFFFSSNQSLTISSSLVKYSFHNQAATKQNHDSLLFHLLKNVLTASLSLQHNYSSSFSSTQFILFKFAVSPTLFNWCLRFRLRFGWNGAPHLTADSTSLQSRMWVWLAFNRRPENSANNDIIPWRLTSVFCFNEDRPKARCYYCACNIGCQNECHHRHWEWWRDEGIYATTSPCLHQPSFIFKHFLIGTKQYEIRIRTEQKIAILFTCKEIWGRYFQILVTNNWGPRVWGLDRFRPSSFTVEVPVRGGAPGATVGLCLRLSHEIPLQGCRAW